MKINVPTSLINKLTHQISIDIHFHKAPETVKQKVLKACAHLWYLIFDAQINDATCLSLHYFTGIHTKSLDKKEMTVIYNNHRYRYSQFLDILEAASLIEINDKFSIGNFPMSYRVNRSVISGEFKLIQIDFKLLTKNTRNKSYWLKWYPQYAELINDCYRTKVDLVPYNNWLNQNIGINLGKKPLEITGFKDGAKINYSVMKDRFLDAERIMRYTNAAIKQNIGNLWFKVSDECRFYNSVISLSSTAIPYLILNKRKLKSIDIANSQPLLLASMIDNEAYKNDCGAGKFYQRIMDKMGKQKEEVKNLLYKYLFFTNEPLKGGALYKAFEALYPGVIQQINTIKERLSLSHHLQKMEAEIIVEGAGRLDFPKILRHDQVLMYEEHYQDVVDYLKQAYQKLGLEVSFKS